MSQQERSCGILANLQSISNISGQTREVLRVIASLQTQRNFRYLHTQVRRPGKPRTNGKIPGDIGEHPLMQETQLYRPNAYNPYHTSPKPGTQIHLSDDVIHVYHVLVSLAIVQRIAKGEAGYAQKYQEPPSPMSK
ncbi:hypothetical protein PG993_003212 [Apiospora rasikravindrae]|uniref:Uncharacterized protein n=1 Tax=Apiospora rasikravindrae TaxID=990691 RepID=A0ABR1TYY0_9PEZI